MSHRVVVAAPAARQIREEAAWWRQHRRNAPDLLRDELTHAFRLLAEQPFAGARVDDPDLASVRRLTLAHTHHWLYYTFSEDTVTILALWHQMRHAHPDLSTR